MNKENKKQKWIGALVQVIAWLIVFAFPLLFVEKDMESALDIKTFFKHSIVPVAFIITYYINTCWLIPHYLFKRRVATFIISNILLIAFICTGMNYWQRRVVGPMNQTVVIVKTSDTQSIQKPLQKMPQAMEPGPGGPEIRPFYGRPGGPNGIRPGGRRGIRRGHNRMIFMKDAFSLIFIIGLACSIKMTERYTKTEKSLRAAEEEKAKAELDNLKNQLNPHFLLNTLNNIYALISIDQDKAQEAVHQLSKLLRHVLYEDQQQFVPIQNEIEFLKNYIELMKIRLSGNCQVVFNADIQTNSNAKIAPLLLISLVENSFKHGVSPTEKSFIFINITQITLDMQSKISCLIENSYYPKDERDKSGSGVGLKQVQTRLDLLYKDHYKWDKGIVDVDGKGKLYRSVLELDSF